MEGLHSYMLSKLRMLWLSAPEPISDPATRSDEGRELGQMQEIWMSKGVEGNRSGVLDTMKPGGGKRIGRRQGALRYRTPG
jgi:hypothetical protein